MSDEQNLISVLRKKGRSGTTLVELLVVVLIITILSAMLLPTFTKNVVQARYAAEAIPFISQVRTAIATYQYENNKLPFDEPGVYTYVQEGASYALKFAPYTGGQIGGRQSWTKTSPFKKMEIPIGSMTGKKLTPDQISVICLRNDKAYIYAIGVFGSADGLSEGTGYAVMEAWFPDCVVSSSGDTASESTEKGYRLVATWKNYSGEGSSDEPAQISFGIASSGSESEGKCELFSDTYLSASSFSAGGLGVRGAVNTLLASPCGSWEVPALPGGN